MSFEITFCDTPPERAMMDELLREYYTGILAKIAILGGPSVPLHNAIPDFWAHIDDFLPPKGRLCLAVDTETGEPVGCGTLSVPEPGIGELKRLFVKDAARGHGVGRALVTCRIEEARAMGLKTLLVDTVQNTDEMQKIYTSLGFRRIPRYQQSGTANAFPQLRKVMVFFRLEL